jgi:diaminopimelate epimerase
MAQRRIPFYKMNGAGNDFIVLDNRERRWDDAALARLAQTWCPRRTGVGADGLLALNPPEDPAHAYRMRYRNADGSHATMCGNGARCLARLAHRLGVGGDAFTFESDAGPYRAELRGEDGALVRLYVAPPRDYAPNVALPAAEKIGTGPVHYVWTGTEHLVCFVEDVASVPVDTWGAALRGDDTLPPPGANANFVTVLRASPEDTGPTPGEEHAPAALQVRTFEKGVEGETQACGTGALAAAVVAHRQGHTQARPVAVHMPGGRLQVGFREADGAITDLYLEGPAHFVYEGTLPVEG